MATSYDIFTQFLSDLGQSSSYTSWLRDNCGKTQGGTPSSPKAGTPAALWYAFRDKVVARKAKPSDAPNMGSNHYGWSLVRAALMPLYPPDPNIVPPAPAPTSQCYTCVRIDGQFYVTNAAAGGYSPPDSADAPWSWNEIGGSWDLFEAHAQHKMSAIHYGGPGTTLPGTNSQPVFDKGAMTDCRNRNAFASYTLAASTAQMLDLANNSNVNGTLTAIDAVATAVAQVGHPILIRFCHEMNANFSGANLYPWQPNAGVSSAQYKAAWITAVTRIRALAPNASFFWCPTIYNPPSSNVFDPTAWFPGLAYVDAVGFDGYAYVGTYVSPSSVFGNTLAIVKGLALNVPIVIGETGVDPAISSPGKAAWITDFLTSWLPAHPEIKMFSWFNEVGSPAQPHIEVGDGANVFGSTAQAAYAAGLTGTRYLGNVVTATTFPSGQKVPWPS